MLFECLQDVLGGRAGFFLAVINITNLMMTIVLLLMIQTMMMTVMMMMVISIQVNSYLVDVTSENTRTARLFLT